MLYTFVKMITIDQNYQQKEWKVQNLIEKLLSEMSEFYYKSTLTLQLYKGRLESDPYFKIKTKPV